MPNLPELPRTFLDTTYIPPTGKSIAVKAGADLQAYLDTAKPGDEVVLESGAVWTGNFFLRPFTGPGWITVRSSDPASLPREGWRTTPANWPRMAKIQTDNLGPALLNQSDRAVHHWRIMGIEIAMSPQSVGTYDVVELDTPNADPATAPHDITLDRCYIHGNAMGSARRGVQLGGARLAVIDSWIDNIHSIWGRGTESNAIASWNCSGPYKLRNNRLEAATENIIIGGALGPIRGIPSDIEITRNYFTKPDRWRNAIIPAPKVFAKLTDNPVGPRRWYQVVANGMSGADSGILPISSGYTELVADGAAALSWAPVTYSDATDPRTAESYTVYRTFDPPEVSPRKIETLITVLGTAFLDIGADPIAKFLDFATPGQRNTRQTGDGYAIKNLLEFKNAKRVLVEGNILENCWPAAQGGTAVLLTPRALDGTFAEAEVSDLTFRHNEIRRAAGAFAVSAHDDHPGWTVESARVLIENNYAHEMDSRQACGLLVYGAVDLTVNRSTFLTSGEFSCGQNLVQWGTKRERITNCVFQGDMASSTPQLPGPQGFFGPPDALNEGAVFSRNVIHNATAFPLSDKWAKASPDSLFREGTTHPIPDSVGVDFAALKLATDGVIDGAPPPAPPAPPAAPVIDDAAWRADVLRLLGSIANALGAKQ
ncbi:MAG: hypothetical protein NVS1B5_14570 [Gemmatimonadaceae bacterium]